MQKMMKRSCPPTREENRETWRKVHTKIYVTKWLLLAVAILILLTAIAAWGWSVRAPIWGYPVVVVSFLWLYFFGGLVWLRITGWRAYVSLILYMEALEDGVCKDTRFTWEGCRQWYRDNGSPWRL